MSQDFLRVVMMTLSRSISSFGRLPRHLWLASKALFVFRRALTFLARYMRWNWPIAEPVELRNGVQIHLRAPDDIATLVEVFLRRQYGPISSESVVVNVGANIGVFSLFTLAEGARLEMYRRRKVPAVKAYNLICRRSPG